MAGFRIGHGYDVHRLTANRKLILGGVEIPYPIGLLGHSDADVLIHALMDSLLGALALGDIGKFFPDTDNTYKNADSLVLLKKVSELMVLHSFKVVNIDATIIAEQPKLSPYIGIMRENISTVLETAVENISIKATTEEGLGVSGNSEGISAHCVCLVEKCGINQ